MKKVLVSVAVLVASFAVFAFDAAQTEEQVTQEINERVARGETLEQVAAAANAARVPVATFLAAFTSTGKTIDTAVASAVAGGYVADTVVNAAVARGADPVAMNQIALSSLPATGAGPTGNQNAGANDGLDAGGQSGGSVLGGNRSSTIGGGGSGSVSPT